MKVSWDISIEMWSWFSYEINVKISYGNFHEYFIIDLFMKFWWISYEYSRLPIHTENSYWILKKFIWPFHDEINVYLSWNHSYEFPMTFLWIIHVFMKWWTIHFLLMKSIWISYECFICWNEENSPYEILMKFIWILQFHENFIKILTFHMNFIWNSWTVFAGMEAGSSFAGTFFRGFFNINY